MSRSEGRAAGNKNRKNKSKKRWPDRPSRFSGVPANVMRTLLATVLSWLVQTIAGEQRNSERPAVSIWQVGNMARIELL